MQVSKERYLLTVAAICAVCFFALLAGAVCFAQDAPVDVIAIQESEVSPVTAAPVEGRKRPKPDRHHKHDEDEVQPDIPEPPPRPEPNPKPRPKPVPDDNFHVKPLPQPDSKPDVKPKPDVHPAPSPEPKPHPQPENPVEPDDEDEPHISGGNSVLLVSGIVGVLLLLVVGGAWFAIRRQ